MHHTCDGCNRLGIQHGGGAEAKWPDTAMSGSEKSQCCDQA